MDGDGNLPHLDEFEGGDLVTRDGADVHRILYVQSVTTQRMYSHRCQRISLR